jgi:hypothetical protein
MEGFCYDWTGTWNVQSAGGDTNITMYKGFIDYKNTGGSCGPPSGAAYQDTVEAAVTWGAWLARGTWIASRGGGKSNSPLDVNQVCDYSGTVQGNELIGTYYCGVTPNRRGPYNITIRR